MLLHRLKSLLPFGRTRLRTERVCCSALAAAIAGSAGMATYVATSEGQNNSKSTEVRCLARSGNHLASEVSAEAFGHTPSILAASPNSAKSVAEREVECDFIVVGYGSAGRAAVGSLKQLCPRASIAVVDPMGLPSSASAKSQGGHDKRIKLLPQFAERLDQEKVYLSNGTKLKFRHSILLATGSRGAPPPPSLIDKEAMERVLELRSTAMPLQSSGIDGRSSRRPIMSPEGVRQLSIMAASQGARVCVLGSGLESIELAAAAAFGGNKDLQRRRTKQKRLEESAKNGAVEAAKVSLVFGNAGPLSTRLPRYLSTAVSKRLRQHGIDVQERSLVRYVAMHGGDLEVHTAKSFDTLDTARTNADLLVVAPSVDGQKGTAVLPKRSDEGHDIAMTAPLFEPWSNQGHRALTCFVDDGRIVVNKELNAASRVFAAGSVARHPGTAGHSTVSGEGVIDGRRAGEVAAHNMAREYNERRRKGKKTAKLSNSRIFSENSFPIWRTDVCPYITNESSSGATNVQSQLSSVGVHALCIGQCDSEVMSTHGHWWTNQSADNRRKHAIANQQKNRSFATRRSTKKSSMTRRVYGSGVVFYLDRSGAVRGIMLWGLPFTQGDGRELNRHLVDRMKHVLATNGTTCLEQHEDVVVEQSGGKQNTGLLTSLHLSEESKLLASIALSSGSTKYVSSQLVSSADTSGIAKPLHRYLPSKPSRITGIGVLKRNADDTVFVRSSEADNADGEAERPQSLIYVYPMEWGNGSNIGGDATQFNDGIGDDFDEEPWSRKKAQSSSETRSRPPKEEPLWLRRDESNKRTSMNDVLAEVFQLNVRHGRFRDGSDAVVQAPVPRVILNAQDKYKKWTTSDDESGETEEEG